MRPQVRAFRDVAAQVCQARRFSFRAFMEDRGLEPILNEAEASGWSARQIACQVLARCCVEEGRFNNFQVGLLAVLTFLREQVGPLSEQGLRDLVAVLNNPGTAEAIERWMQSAYP
jgi:hypothetical protein